MCIPPPPDPRRWLYVGELCVAIFGSAVCCSGFLGQVGSPERLRSIYGPGAIRVEDWQKRVICYWAAEGQVRAEG